MEEIISPKMSKATAFIKYINLKNLLQPRSWNEKNRKGCQGSLQLECIFRLQNKPFHEPSVQVEER